METTITIFDKLHQRHPEPWKASENQIQSTMPTQAKRTIGLMITRQPQTARIYTKNIARHTHTKRNNNFFLPYGKTTTKTTLLTDDNNHIDTLLSFRLVSVRCVFVFILALLSHSLLSLISSLFFISFLRLRTLAR